jgi:hypothetical protein
MSIRQIGLTVVIATIAVLSAASIDAASAHSRSRHHRHHQVQRPHQPTYQICRGIPPHTQCVPVKR